MASTPPDDNSSAAANMVSTGAAGGFRNLVQSIIQQKLNMPLLQQQIQQGANTTALSNLAAQNAQNEAAVNAFTPDYSQVQNPAKQAAISAATADGANLPGDKPAGPNAPVYAKVPAPQTQQDTQAFNQQYGVNMPWVPDATSRPQTWNIPADSIPDADPSGQLYAQLPGYAQQQLYQQYKSAAPNPNLVTPEMVAQAHDSKVQATKIPPLSSTILSNPNLRIQNASIGPGGPTANFISNANVALPVTEPGTAPGGPAPFVNVNGQTLPNPNYLKPEDVKTGADELNTLQNAQVQTGAIRQMLDENPHLVGPGVTSGGGAIAQGIGHAKAYVGDPTQFNQQRQINQFMTDQLLQSLSLIHMGRITEREFGYIQTRLPKMTDPKEVWDQYLNRYQNALNKEVSQRQATLSPYLGQQLPDVSSPGQSAVQAPQSPQGSQAAPQPGRAASVSVVAPGTTGVGDGTVPGTASPAQSGGGASAVRTIWPGQEGTVLPGQVVVWGPTGQRIRK